MKPVRRMCLRDEQCPDLRSPPAPSTTDKIPDCNLNIPNLADLVDSTRNDRRWNIHAAKTRTAISSTLETLRDVGLGEYQTRSQPSA